MLSSLKLQFNFGANDSKCQSVIQLFGLMCVQGGVGGTDMEVRVKDKSCFLWKDVHLLTSKLFPSFQTQKMKQQLQERPQTCGLDCPPEQTKPG